MKKLTCVLVFMGLTISAIPAYAHHSFAATFTEDIITVEGYVERLKFSNPHVMVFFRLTDENGREQEWRSEGSSATAMRSEGWDKDTLVEGDYVRITGNSTRNGTPMVSMEDIEFVNPSTGAVVGIPGGPDIEDVLVLNKPLQLPNGLPNFSGEWTGEATGRGGRPIDHVPPMDYNEAGAALHAVFDAVNDPQVWCEPPGLVRQAGFSPHPVRIEQYDDHVVISYEEYGGVRTVYFDKRDMVGGEKTHLGQSWARYEGQTLIIESNNLLPNLSATTGNALTDQTSTVETYYRTDTDEGRAVLSLDMVATDPGYLLTPWTVSWSKYGENDYEFIEVECEAPLRN
jgi:hypothetical protein|tara:strand:- start:118486 stop:119514 length:1029 start_codon:yes stop_codon:yes gene_type:complete